MKIALISCNPHSKNYLVRAEQKMNSKNVFHQISFLARLTSKNLSNIVDFNKSVVRKGKKTGIL